MDFKKSFNRAVTNVVQFFANGLSQSATDRDAEKEVTPGMPELLRRAAAEGAVLIENNGVLPLKEGTKVALFGITGYESHYVGYGSGGDVNKPYAVSFADGIENCDRLEIDKVLESTYENWDKQNPINHGLWGHWPFYFPEMPLDKQTVRESKSRNDVAVAVIGRSAGEDRDCNLEKGSYYLADDEIAMLDMIAAEFDNIVILLNIGGITDMTWVEKYRDKIGAILIVWQGGMECGNAAADLLCGNVSPSGHLTDTIAKRYEDYPSSSSFGGKDFNEYKEDIYVGYRYFETFAKDKVLYPFGYGLSYTDFEISSNMSEETDRGFRFAVSVKNIGHSVGKEAVQLYLRKPCGRLGNPERILVAFKKTGELAPNEEARLDLFVEKSQLSSYDEDISAYVIERGKYEFFLGKNVRDNDLIYSFEQTDEEIISQLAKNGECTMEQFVAQLNNKELEAISRGDYVMNSPLGAKGNAGVFGGVLHSLRAKGVEPITTTDGPSGIRLSASCSLMPVGTLFACSFNPELVEEVYSAIAAEMKAKGSDVLLAPGMNIHRNPLCGRNFEYYSEDPYLAGKTAAAAVRGIQSRGASACPKHFACNSQEKRRNMNDSRLSERALREIYLKGFEICVKESEPKNIMTSYNRINSVYGHYNYELCTTILRDEWGYKGNVITDWWMKSERSPEFPSIRDQAYRVRAQVDVLMPGGGRSKRRRPDGTLLESLGKQGGITLGELQRTAINVLKAVIDIKI